MVGRSVSPFPETHLNRFPEFDIEQWKNFLKMSNLQVFWAKIICYCEFQETGNKFLVRFDMRVNGKNVGMILFFKAAVEIAQKYFFFECFNFCPQKFSAKFEKTVQIGPSKC